MIGSTFQAVMTKYSHVNKENQVFVIVAIKHVSEGDVQSFLDSFEKSVGTDNYKPLFSYPVRWKTIKIDTSDYEKNYFEVGFADFAFDAQLVEIAVVRKNKNGSDIFEYTMTFLKDVGNNNEDAIIASTYLKHKEENEDGKMVIQEFDVDLVLADQKQKLNPEDTKVF